jgi:TPR repeat protein
MEGEMIDSDLKYIEAGNLYDKKKYQEAFSIWMALANNNHAPSMYALYHMYLNGQGVIQDTEEAYIWLEKSADAECIDAMYYFGAYLIDNNKEVEKGIKYIEKSADANYPKAIHNIAYNYEWGEDGYPINLDKALELYKRAFELGEQEAVKKHLLLYKKKYGNKQFLWYMTRNLFLLRKYW